jgi:hypothetical protein
LIVLGQSCLLNAESFSNIRNTYVCYGRHGLRYDQVIEESEIGHFTSSITYSLPTHLAYRALISESFEFIKSYCRGTHQLDKLERASWYQFARILRNAFNHDFKLKPGSIKSPVIWNNNGTIPREIVIEPYMTDWDIALRKDPCSPSKNLIEFSLDEALTLFDEMYEFAEIVLI